MITDLLSGFTQLLSIENFLFINIGVFLGIIFGAIPGLSGYLGIVILMPITYSMSPLSGISMLIAIYCGGAYGGSISAILLGTPGSNEAAATVLDGYPLAKQGKAKRALEAALVASTMGGIISSLCLLFAAPAISQLTLSFAAPEYFAVSIFGVSIIAGVSGKSIVKGLISGCIGFMISMVGMDSLSGIYRFTFGNLELSSGFNTIGVMLGVFALPAVFEKIEKKLYKDGSTVDIEIDKEKGFGWSDFKKHFATMLKSSGIGVGIGALPGAGAAVAAFVSYNEAKRVSKHPEEFGKGSIEGVVAPESGNNAVTAASLIPLLTLAVPGSAAAAALTGALMIHGMVPGPQLFSTQGPAMYAILIGVLFANIFMLVQGKLLARFFAKISKVPQMVLIPALLIFCFAGAFSAANSEFNVSVLLAFGIFAYIFTKLDFPTVPLVLGMILGPIAETNLRNSLIMSGGSFSIFFTRPISLVILILAVVFIVILRRQAVKLEKMAK